MNNKRLYVLFLTLPIIFMVFWVSLLQWQRFNAVDVKIAATGYDPRNLISGHYLNLRLDWGKTDCNQFYEARCPVERFEEIYNFYLSEDDAKYLDKVILGNSNLNLELVFANLKDNKPQLKNMLIEGLTWKQWVEQNYQPKN